MKLHYFTIVNSPTSDQLNLLNTNIIGTPGQSMLYQHLGVSNKINKISNPCYVNLERNNKVIGTGCFCNRPTLNNGKMIDAFYIRYFSFKEHYRVKKVIARHEVLRKGKLREEISYLLKGQEFNKKDGDTFYYYAYVDPRNIRSVALCNEFGFEPVRQYTTIIFNRIYPKDDKRVVPVALAETSSVKELLRNFYKEYTMFSEENLFNSRKYYIIKDIRGKIIAGIGVNPEHWKIHSLPGLSGKFILNTFSYIPYLNRLFNKDYYFLTLEGIYFSPGFEDHLSILFESLLARYKINNAIICVDTESSLYAALRALSLGIVDRLNKEVRGNIICNFVNFTEEDKAMFKSRPAYISGIDVT